MIRRFLIICCGLLAILWVLFTEYRLWDLRDQVDWSAWFSTVSIACQGHSKDRIVKCVLGKPAREENMANLSYPWIAQYVRSPGRVSSVYVYRHMSLRNRGLWYAYVFLDAKGDVVDYRVFPASDAFTIGAPAQ
ncbi:MAG: hypothetical protein GX141_05275 [Armatimonadetes bacterium]|jgi:hypothetical protein|nr:hypothetical protein [Armatimonadota bacterium]